MIDISDWRFESEEPLEELNLYDERACAIFEDELREMIAGHMAKQKEAQNSRVMRKEVMIRYCVGEKGSRKAVLEVWAEDSEDLPYDILHVFVNRPEITLAQVFGTRNGEMVFLRQYEWPH